MLRSTTLSLLSAALLLAGCGNSSSVSAPAPTPTPAPFPTTIPTNASTIKHIIMQENRSFDNLFNGFPGADTAASGISNGQTVQLQPIPFEQGTDLDHSHIGWWTDWDNGRLDGFSHAKSYPSPISPIPNLPHPQSPLRLHPAK